MSILGTINSAAKWLWPRVRGFLAPRPDKPDLTKRDLWNEIRSEIKTLRERVAVLETAYANSVTANAHLASENTKLLVRCTRLESEVNELRGKLDLPLHDYSNPPTL